jgi:phosphatidylserine decarboxylase
MICAEGPGRRVRIGVGEGQTLRLGETIGVVLFAGHADIYLPPGIEPFITAGQRTVGAETILGKILVAAAL